MLIKKLLPFLFFLLFLHPIHSQQWQSLDIPVKSSFRGLCVVNDSTVWASGTKGTFVLTTDGGNTWKVDSISGATQLDFRDIEAFDSKAALVISSGEVGKIFKTTDGGKSWSETYSGKIRGLFFDGFAFWDREKGIAFSDPVNGKFFVITTSDGGDTWKEIDHKAMPPALEKEAAFAASGTSICTKGKGHVWIGTGGDSAARVFYSPDYGNSWNVYNTPLKSGEATGIFSISFYDEKSGVIVGGNYQQPNNDSANCALTTDGGKTWKLAKKNPGGYRSCVTYMDRKTLICVGTNGSDVSWDGGMKWEKISKEGFNVCGTVNYKIVAAGGKGMFVTNIMGYDKIKSRQYHHFTLKQAECEEPKSDSVLYEIKDLVYPEAATTDPVLNKKLNSRIKEIFGEEYWKNPSRVMASDKFSWTCILDKPFEIYSDFSVTFSSSRFLSLIIAIDNYACCGANGASHKQYPVTFDLKKNNFMTVKDVLNDQYDSTLYTICIVELKRIYPQLFESYGEPNNPGLFHFRSMLTYPMAITTDGILIFWHVSWGGKSSTESVEIKFNNHPEIFKKEFILTVEKK